jgi:hypothetical protein
VNAGFAERLLEVIDSGRRTATYKLAVLLAMLDLCARRSDTRGRAPRVLYTRDIAEQVASLYWPQVIPYLVPGAASAEVLRQISLPRAAIVAAVSSFRSAAKAGGATSWQLARPRLPGAYRTMLDQVEVIVAGQPLPRLQAAGSAQAVFPFLYELSWGPRPGHRRPVGLRPGRDHSRGPLDLQPPAPSRHPAMARVQRRCRSRPRHGHSGPEPVTDRLGNAAAALRPVGAKWEAIIGRCQAMLSLLKSSTSAI